MDNDGILEDILTRGYSLPWGVSCLHFSYKENSATSEIEAYFKERRIPVSFIFSEKSSVNKVINSKDRRIFSIEDLLITEKTG